jgi:hypothetical protein
MKRHEDAWSLERNFFWRLRYRMKTYRSLNSRVLLYFSLILFSSVHSHPIIALPPRLFQVICLSKCRISCGRGARRITSCSLQQAQGICCLPMRASNFKSTPATLQPIWMIREKPPVWLMVPRLLPGLFCTKHRTCLLRVPAKTAAGVTASRAKIPTYKMNHRDPKRH